MQDTPTARATGPGATSGAPRRGSPYPPQAWQRSWVRVTERGDGVRFELVGLGHRAPVSRTISAAAASRLVRRGVPVVVHRVGPARTGPARTGG